MYPNWANAAFLYWSFCKALVDAPKTVKQLASFCWTWVAKCCSPLYIWKVKVIKWTIHCHGGTDTQVPALSLGQKRQSLRECQNPQISRWNESNSPIHLHLGDACVIDKTSQSLICTIKYHMPTHDRAQPSLSCFFGNWMAKFWLIPLVMRVHILQHTEQSSSLKEWWWRVESYHLWCR